MAVIGSLRSYVTAKADNNTANPASASWPAGIQEGDILFASGTYNSYWSCGAGLILVTAAVLADPLTYGVSYIDGGAAAVGVLACFEAGDEPWPNEGVYTTGTETPVLTQATSYETDSHSSNNVPPDSQVFVLDAWSGADAPWTYNGDRVGTWHYSPQVVDYWYARTRRSGTNAPATPTIAGLTNSTLIAAADSNLAAFLDSGFQPQRELSTVLAAYDIDGTAGASEATCTNGLPGNTTLDGATRTSLRWRDPSPVDAFILDLERQGLNDVRVEVDLDVYLAEYEGTYTWWVTWGDGETTYGGFTTPIWVPLDNFPADSWHTYAEPGTYTITMNVQTQFNSATATTSVRIAEAADRPTIQRPTKIQGAALPHRLHTGMVK